MNLVKHFRQLLALQKEGGPGVVTSIYNFMIQRAPVRGIMSMKSAGEEKEEGEKEKR